jgi:alkaline phosphatase
MIIILSQKTYCTDAQVADSACSATAYLCGVKTDIDTIGLDSNVIYKNCSTQNDQANQVSSIMAWAQVDTALYTPPPPPPLLSYTLNFKLWIIW